MMLLTLAATMAAPADAGRIFGNRSTRRQPSRSSRSVQRPVQRSVQRPVQQPQPAARPTQPAPSSSVAGPPPAPPAAGRSTTARPVRQYRPVTQAEVQRLTDQLLALSAGERAASPFDAATFRRRLAASLPAYPRQIDGWVQPGLTALQDSLLVFLKKQTANGAYELLRTTIAEDGQSATIAVWLTDSAAPIYYEYQVAMTPRGYLIVDVYQSDHSCELSDVMAIAVAAGVVAEHSARSPLVPQSFRDWHQVFNLSVSAKADPPQSLAELKAMQTRIPAGCRQHPWTDSLIATVAATIPVSKSERQTALAELIKDAPGCHVSHVFYYLFTNDYAPTPQYYESVQSLIDRFGPDPRLIGALGSAHFAEGDRDAAQDYYEQALETRSQQEATFDRTIRDELALGTVEAAQAWADRAAAATGETWSLDDFEVERYFLDRDRMDELAMQLTGLIIDPDLLKSDDSPLDPIAYANRIYTAGGIDGPKLGELAMPMLVDEVSSLAETIVPAIEAIKDGGSYDFQQAVIDDDRMGGRLIFRYEDGEGFDSYDQWIVARTGDQTFRIVDVIEMQVGLPKSEFGAMNVVDNLVVAPLAGNHLTPAIRELHRTSRAIIKLQVLVQDERYEKALEVWEALPERYRLSSNSLAEAMVARRALEDWTDEQAALWMLSQNPDCDYARHMLYLSMSDEKATPGMVDALTKLNERLPGDPSLMVSLAVANLAIGGELSESMRHIEAALERVPTNSAVYLAAVKLQARYGTPADTLAWLKRADETVTISWQGLPDWPEMTDFLKTDEYALWLDHLGGGPSYERRRRMARRPQVTL